MITYQDSITGQQKTPLSAEDMTNVKGLAFRYIKAFLDAESRNVKVRTIAELRRLAGFTKRNSTIESKLTSALVDDNNTEHQPVFSYQLEKTAKNRLCRYLTINTEHVAVKNINKAEMLDAWDMI